MNEIILTDDDLKRLEKRFGPAVRHMGSWNSDGTFSYLAVPITTVQKAADALNDPALLEFVHQLSDKPGRVTEFTELLQRFGPTLVDSIVASRRERLPIGAAIPRPRSATNVA